MQNNRKLLFFDIDKTLLTPYPWRVPPVQDCLKKPTIKWTPAFCQLRTYLCHDPEIIRKIGFDGYVCGCGSQIYMNGELLFSSSIPNSLCREIIEILKKFAKIPAIFLSVRTKFLYDNGSCSLPGAIQNLKTEVEVEDLSLYTSEIYHSFTFDKFLAFPAADSDTDTFRNLLMNIFCVLSMMIKPGN